jgi:hypothetical protein
MPNGWRDAWIQRLERTLALGGYRKDRLELFLLVQRKRPSRDLFLVLTLRVGHEKSCVGFRRLGLPLQLFQFLILLFLLFGLPSFALTSMTADENNPLRKAGSRPKSFNTTR